MAMHHSNPPTRERTIVKVRRSGEQYLVCGPDRSGMQYRARHGMPTELRNALDRSGRVFAYAFLNSAGRWHLDGLAPPQPW